MRAAKDLYEVLGLTRGASQDDVRRAHRRLVREYHPDANPGDRSAEERFKEIQHAYEVLSDEAKRREYDKELRDSASSPSSGKSGRAHAKAAANDATGGRSTSGADLSELVGKLKEILLNARSGGSSTTKDRFGSDPHGASSKTREKRVRGPKAQKKEKRVKGPKARRKSKGS